MRRAGAVVRAMAPISSRPAHPDLVGAHPGRARYGAHGDVRWAAEGHAQPVAPAAGPVAWPRVRRGVDDPRILVEHLSHGGRRRAPGRAPERPPGLASLR